LLVDDDETEVEDNDEGEEAEAHAERDAELRAADVAIREAAAHRDTELATRASEERHERCHAEDLAESCIKVQATLTTAEAQRVAAAEATERVAHWAAEMDKALAYRRDVDQREAGHRA
jgi:hypothetical protein